MTHWLLIIGLIHFLGGKPRGGKSLRALMMIVKELREGRRPIVTNLAVKLDELQDYCDRHEIRTNVLQRITILDKDQTKRFWRFRGYGLELEPNLDGTNRHKKTGEILPNEQQPLELGPIYGEGWQDEAMADPDAGSAYRKLGVFYVIDEAHMHFGSRYWERTEDEALWYGSQHGKLRDTVFFVTQSISNVVKQLRDLAQDYRYCRNLRKEKRGWFKAGNHFVEHVHLKVQQPNAAEDEPIETHRYEMDPELIECYDTSAGVGVPGGGQADKGERAKGINVKWVWAAAALGFAVLWVGAGYLPKILKYGLVHVSGIDPEKRPSQVRPLPAARPSAAAMAGIQPAGGAATAAPGITAMPQETPKGEPLWVTGVIGRRVGGTWLVNVMLSDGRTLTEGDGTLARVDRASVVLADGTRVYMKRIAPGPAAADRSNQSKEGSPIAKAAEETRVREVPGKELPAREPPKRPTIEKRTG